MVKEMVVDPTMEYYSARNSKKLLTHTTIWMKLKEIMLSEKKSQPLKNTLYNFIYITFNK